MNRKYQLFVISILLIFVFAFTACAPQATAEPTMAPATETPTEVMAPANPDIILATTTSTRDSGLLDVLLPMFEATNRLQCENGCCRYRCSIGYG